MLCGQIQERRVSGASHGHKYRSLTEAGLWSCDGGEGLVDCWEERDRLLRTTVLSQCDVHGASWPVRTSL